MSGGGEDDGQEKVFDPTPQKLQQAREKGDVPKSNDINAAAMYVGVCLTLIIAGSSVGNDLGAPLAAMLARPEEFSTAFLGSGYGTMTGSVLSSIALAILPVFLIPFAAVILSLVAQRAFVVAPSKLEMKLNRISPISNAKNKFGPQGLVEFLKSLVKLIIVAIIAGVVIWSLRGDLYTMMAVDARAMPRYLAETGMILLIATTILAGVIGAADMLWQVHSHRQKLRMSLQEMRDETKQSEGDPHMKQQRAQRGRQIAGNRMMFDVPEADVIIVNPTHYAVALKWDRERGSAPKCVAKGVDEIALKIREIAGEHDVPIHSDPPTARALHATVEIDDEIQPEHYQAVAAAIRFADAMRQKRR